MHDAGQLIERVFRRWEVQIHAHALADLPGEVDQNARQVIAVEVESDSKAAIRIQRQRDGRCTAAFLTPAIFPYEIQIHQLTNEVRHRLNRQLRTPRDIGPRERSMQPDRLMDDPQVVFLGVGKVSPDQHSRQVYSLPAQRQLPRRKVSKSYYQNRRSYGGLF